MSARPPRRFFSRFAPRLGRRLGNFVRRLAFAVFLYGATVGILASVHDYPQFQEQMRNFQSGERVAAARPWLNMFYFVNEAGSGLKFLLTGNERHMRHYPSFSHLLAARLARAAAGDWRAEHLVGRMYFLGRGTAVDREAGLYWLRLAHLHAPPERRGEIRGELDAYLAAAAREGGGGAAGEGGWGDGDGWEGGGWGDGGDKWGGGAGEIYGTAGGKI